MLREGDWEFDFTHLVIAVLCGRGGEYHQGLQEREFRWFWQCAMCMLLDCVTHKILTWQRATAIRAFTPMLLLNNNVQ